MYIDHLMVEKLCTGRCVSVHHGAEAESFQSGAWL